jgi:hypothetical protein
MNILFVSLSACEDGLSKFWSMLASLLIPIEMVQNIQGFMWDDENV